MLSKIIMLFENKDSVLCLTDITRCINASPRAVDGMLESLVRMGKIIELEMERKCDRCGAASACVRARGNLRAYTLAHAGVEQEMEAG